MKLMLKVVLAVVLIGVIGLTMHCRGAGDDGDPQGMVIRTYEVPEGFDAQEWAKSLNRALYVNDANKVGEVEIGPGNTLIVTAQQSSIAGVEHLIKTFQQAKPSQTVAEASVAVEYWTLVGRPVDDSGEKIRIASKRLARQDRLRPALQQIVQRQGAMEFILLEQLRLTSLSPSRQASVDGRFMQVHQSVTSARDGQHTADIKIQMVSSKGYRNSIESRVKLIPGQFIVMGQSAINGQDYSTIRPIDDSDGLMLYYVISSEID